MMDSQRRNRMRLNAQRDRLSSLPDDLIYKILSLIALKDVVEMSVLSSRWRYMWKTMPYLSFSSEDFSALPKFSKFVTRYLTYHDFLVDVFSLKVNICGKFGERILKRILNYANTSMVKELTITCLLERKIEFPLDCLDYWPLKRLTLIGSTSGFPITPESTCILASLTTLHLEYVTMSVTNCMNLLYICSKLENVTLNNCCITGSNRFLIHHPNLSDLKLENGCWQSKVVDVIAPQLKNLIIIQCDGEHRISAPELTTLLYKSERFLPVIPDILPSLEKVDLCVGDPDESAAAQIVDLLPQFHNVKFLTLSLEIIERLSSSAELISHQPSPFTDLTRLKIYPEVLSEKAHRGVNMSTEVKNYLLDSSPSATLTLISREDVRAMMDATSAQNFMTDLRVLLNEEKELTESQKTEIHKQGMASSENQRTQPGRKLPVNVCRSLASGHWEDLNIQVQIGRDKTCRIMSLLQLIEDLLKKLPASKRDKLKACFSSLCIEANIVLNEVIDRMKIQWDMKEGRLRDCFHDLAPPTQSSS